MLSKVVNFVIFQIAWFACILGAGNGLPWLGVVGVGASTIGHLVYAKFDLGWILLLASAFVLGWALDWGVLLAGAMGYPEHTQFLTAVPLWMPFMWVNFATTLHLSLGWMKCKYIFGVIFGFLGGPGAYFTGMKLNAVTLGDELVQSLLIIGVEWGIAMPILVLIANTIGRQRAQAQKGTEP